MAPMNSKYPLPNFLCIGVEKCGTTSLYDLLLQHSNIGLSSHKETHFFNTHWHRGIQWYCEKFSHLSSACKMIGEITPAYHRFPEVIPRIKETLGNNIKIIIMLREPRQRAFSHYIHDFANEPRVTDFLFKRYLATCAYAPIVENYYEAFGKENCLTLIFEEDYLLDQQQCIDTISSFFQLPTTMIKPIHSNPSFLPVVFQSPDYPTKIVVDSKELEIPEKSLLYYTHRFHSTKVISDLPKEQQEWIQRQLKEAIHSIPALKSSVIYEQNVKADLDKLEILLDRDLSLWRKSLPDLTAKFAPQPEFLPI